MKTNWLFAAAAATEWRLDSSPRCNRGFNRGIKPAPDEGGRNVFGDVIILSLLPELLPLCGLNPQLALWATSARCSAAWDGNYKPWRLGDLFGKRKNPADVASGVVRKTNSLFAAAAATEWR